MIQFQIRKEEEYSVNPTEIQTLKSNLNLNKDKVIKVPFYIFSNFTSFSSTYVMFYNQRFSPALFIYNLSFIYYNAVYYYDF